MHRFYADETRRGEGAAFLTPEDARHALRVLRMEVGDQAEIYLGGKRYSAEISLIDDQDVRLSLQTELPSTEAKLRITLYQGLPKADKMELIIQKAVELGVHAVVPVAAKRCVVKLDDKKAKSKIARWQSIAEAAAKQSKRRIVPEVTEVMSFKEALAFVKDFDVKIIPYELAENMSKTKEIIEGLRPGQKIAVFIGPEGGFEEAEVQSAMGMGVEPVTLGKRILRTETAGFTVMSWIMYKLEQ